MTDQKTMARAIEILKEQRYYDSIQGLMGWDLWEGLYFFDSAANTASFPWSLQAFGKRSDASPIFIFKGTMAFIYCQKTKNIALQRFSLQKNFLVSFDNSLFHRTVLYYR